MTATSTSTTRGTETELRAAARRRGFTLKELAKKMGVSAGYLSGLSTGRTEWTTSLREKATAVLGEVPGQGIVYRQGGPVIGKSSYIRERAREMGMNLRELADRAGVSYGYMSMVARGRCDMGVKLQARVESALEAPARIEPEKLPCVDRRAIWERMDLLDISQNEVARRAGISSAHLSQIMNGKSSPSAGVLKRLHGVLFQRSKDERVMPAELKVMGWRKGERQGDGGARGGRARAWSQGRRRRRPGRRPRALGREGGVRLPHGVRRQGPGLDDPRGREGLLRHADAGGGRVDAWSGSA